MPGGSEGAWPHIKEIFQKTAAQSEGEPCCDWVGQEGAGHYVKMVHNGIEVRIFLPLQFEKTGKLCIEIYFLNSTVTCN